MQDRVSYVRRLMTSFWTLLIATGLFTVGLSGISLTSIPTGAAEDPHNVLLDFSARWCGPCQKMSPIVSKLERQGYPIRQVDIDDEKALAQKYQVESIPCFVLIANGREINRITGPTDEKQLRAMMMMLPKQNRDDVQLGKSAEKKPPEKLAQAKPADKKANSLLTLPPLFSKKSKEPQSNPPEQDETFRGQSPDRPAVATDQGFAREVLPASIRIRVKDGTHIHYGSGTVIDSRSGRAVILTCGHILRNLQKSAVIEVDLFAEGTAKPQVHLADVLEFDLEADVGLLTIACRQALPTVRLALNRDLPKVDDRVFSIGCGGGKLPSVEEHSVTAINGFAGPENLECTGVPLQGRSGGGLFMGSEQVGVCILADANYKRGIYTGMKPVAQLLRKAKLDYLIPVAGDDTTPGIRSGETNPSLADAPKRKGSGAAPGNNDAMNHLIEQELRGQSSQPGSTATSPEDYTGAEVVVIIRPKNGGGLSRVVIINEATPRILEDLLHESNAGSGRTEIPSTAQRTGNPKPTLIPREAHPPAKVAGKSPAGSRSNPGRSDRPIETSYETQRDRRQAE